MDTTLSTHSKIHQVFVDPNFTADNVSKENLEIISAFSVVIRQKYGTHINGGIKEEGVWKHHWRTLTALPSQRCDLPTGVVGNCFLDILESLTTGYVEC